MPPRRWWRPFVFGWACFLWVVRFLLRFAARQNLETVAGQFCVPSFCVFFFILSAFWKMVPAKRLGVNFTHASLDEHFNPGSKKIGATSNGAPAGSSYGMGPSVFCLGFFSVFSVLKKWSLDGPKLYRSPKELASRTAPKFQPTTGEPILGREKHQPPHKIAAHTGLKNSQLTAPIRA